MKFKPTMLASFKNIKTIEFISDKYVLLTAGSGMIIGVFLNHYLKTHIDPANAFATLHFTASFGVDLIGKASDINNIYYDALLFSFLNIAFARVFYNYDIFLSYILVSLVPLLNIVMLFNGFFIVSMNT